jgi:hypothetical protein
VSRDAMFNNYKVVFPTRPEHSTILTSGTGRCLLMRFTPISFSRKASASPGTRGYGIGTMIRRT